MQKSLKNPRLIQLVSRLDGNPQQIDSFVRSALHYLKEPYEIVRTPENSLDQIEKYGFFIGDCDDASTLIAAMLRVAGYPVRFVVIRTDPKSREFQHVYVEFFDGQHWYSVDPTTEPGTDHQYLERAQVTV